MTTDELRAAADLVLSKPSVTNKYDEAGQKLARHVQRLYDKMPVDEAWMLSVGARQDGGVFVIGDYIEWLPQPGTLYLDDFAVADIATRGDVRRLCEALGVELRGEA